MEVDNVLVGLRAQDFHESLKVTGAFGPKDVHYKRTLLIGKAASLAMHLRGLLFVDNTTQLEYAASSLGISSLELPLVLRELEAVDFVSVVRSNDEIKRVDVRVPEFRSGYSDLGERWKQLKPSEIEHASIVTLDRLHHGPVNKQELLRSLGIENNQFAILSDVMSSGHLLAVQPIEGQPVVFTPLAVDGNPSAYLQWAQRFPNEVQRVVQTLQSQQGIPMGDPTLTEQPALADAVMTGVLMPVQVNGATGPQGFVFAPHGGLTQEERTILDKARAIIACVRYGQNFSAGRRVKYPRRILETLKDSKRFGRGHPDLFSQYGLLVEKLIGHPFEESTGRWNFELHDTDENMKALQVAIEMLEYGESPSARLDLDAQKALLTPTGYLGPPSARPRLAEEFKVSSETRAEIISQMANLARGIG